MSGVVDLTDHVGTVPNDDGRGQQPATVTVIDGSPSTSKPTRYHLMSLLLIAVSGAFVTALVAFGGDLRTYWPLYLIPIVTAALTYHLSGALVTSAIATALIALLTPGAGLTAGSLPQIGVGMLSFVLAGAVIGVQARRQLQQNIQLEQSSIRDRLTGLYKSDYFHGRLAEELIRTDRYGDAVSIALITVEDFESFKSRFGHYKADLLLEHMADVLRVSVRTTDILSRYGPTTFAAILPCTKDFEATAVAARLRTAVGEAEFEGDVLEPAVKCGVAVANVSYPDEAQDQDEMLELASQRLLGELRGETVSLPRAAVSGRLEEVST